MRASSSGAEKRSRDEKIPEAFQMRTHVLAGSSYTIPELRHIAHRIIMINK
jgi:hypothetical protein